MPVKLFQTLAASFGLAAFQAAGAALSDHDRQQLIDHLYRTRMLLVEEVRTVNAGQATFKPGPESWSILECVEHLIEAERFLLDRAAKSSESLETSKITDQAVLEGFGTVQQKVKAPVAIKPAGRFHDVASAIREFDVRRAETIRYVASTQENLRGKLCCGGMQEYQQILGLSAHVERHVAQMKAVKADPKYPVR